MLGKIISFQDIGTRLTLHSYNQTSLNFKCPAITAHYGWGDETIILSRPVTFPLNETDAYLISTESDCLCDGQLTLQDGYWIFYCCDEYPDCEIRINQNNGEVFCSHFG